MVAPAYRKWVFRKWDIVYNVVLRVKRINTVYTINYLTIYTIVFNLVNHSCIGYHHIRFRNNAATITKQKLCEIYAIAVKNQRKKLINLENWQQQLSIYYPSERVDLKKTRPFTPP